MSTAGFLEEIDSARPAVLDDLEAHLQCRLSGRIRDFRLSTGSGGLILLGRAPTYYAKQLAQQAVMDATDWPIAANEIVVD